MTRTKTLVSKLLNEQVLMKEQPSTQVTHFRKHNMKMLQMPQKFVYKTFYVHEQILRTRNCRPKFIKNLLPEKRKENM